MLNNFNKKVNEKDLQGLKRAKEIANDAYRAMSNLFVELDDDPDRLGVIKEIIDLVDALESVKHHADLLVSHANLINRYNDKCNHN